MSDETLSPGTCIPQDPKKSSPDNLVVLKGRKPSRGRRTGQPPAPSRDGNKLKRLVAWAERAGIDPGSDLDAFLLQESLTEILNALSQVEEEAVDSVNMRKVHWGLWKVSADIEARFYVQATENK